jgi:hypothetical protein
MSGRPLSASSNTAMMICPSVAHDDLQGAHVAVSERNRGARLRACFAWLPGRLVHGLLIPAQRSSSASSPAANPGNIVCRRASLVMWTVATLSLM